MSLIPRQRLLHGFERLYRLDRCFNLRLTALGRTFFWSMLLSGVIGVNTTVNMASQIFAFILMLFCVSILMTLLKRKSSYAFKLERKLPEYAINGCTLHYQIYLTNLTKISRLHLQGVENLGFEFPSEDDFNYFYDEDDNFRNAFDRKVGYPKWRKLLDQRMGLRLEPSLRFELAAQKTQKLILEMQPVRRGYVQFNQLIILDADPLGLVNKQIPVSEKQTLLVLPKIYAVMMPKLSSKRIYQPNGNQSARAVADNEEFYGLRDYIPGDPIKNIHWKSWAKTGKPIVKQWRPEYLVRHAIILDTAIPNYCNACFEEALSITCSYIMSANTQESLLDIIYIGEKLYQLSTGFGLDRRKELLKALSCVQPDPQQDFSVLRNTVLSQHDDLSGMIIVLSYWDELRRQFVHDLLKSTDNFRVLLVTQTPIEIDDLPIEIIPLDHVEQALLEL